MYAEMQGRVESLSGELKAKVDIYLEDGVLNLDERAEIENLQSQITSITGKLADAESTAKFETIQAKYSGAKLDADSFAGLHSEMETMAQESAQIYEDALNLSMKSLNLELGNAKEQWDAGELTSEAYKASRTRHGEL